MTDEEWRTYWREAQRRHRAKMSPDEYARFRQRQTARQRERVHAERQHKERQTKVLEAIAAFDAAAPAPVREP